VRKCGGKKEGGRRTEGGDEMCIPQQGRDQAHMCVYGACVCVSVRVCVSECVFCVCVCVCTFQNYWEVT